MARWWREARASADIVAGRGGLWLPGALAWMLTVGWLPLLVAVAQPPTVADLTFLGARTYTSGAWPWNAIAAGGGILLLATTVLVLVAFGETVLAAAGRRGLTGRGVVRAAAIGLVTAAPTVLVLLGTGVAFVIVASREFNAPGAGDPLVRSLRAVAPLGVGVLVTWAAGSVAHAVALRATVLEHAGVSEALIGVPARLRSAGVAGVAATVGSLLVRIAYLGVAGLLLAVLWSPIRAQVAVDGIGAAVAPLLVGFVAIWLCIVLGGGALHAWASVTWTRVLGRRRSDGPDRGPHRPQGDPYRP